MSNPFFGSYWGVPSHSHPSLGGIPVAEAKTKASPKVISIPVHFVGSERSRSDSALKIQKVLRSFLVRKNMKKIAAIGNEVHQIERRVSEQETIDLIKRDAKERLRLKENLMNLLLRLDSVTSVDPGVRGRRKSVIRKAIALQEKLDQIASSSDGQAQDQPAVEVKEEADDVSQKQNLELHIEAGNFCHSEATCEGQAPVKQDEVPEPEDVKAGTGSGPMDECDSLSPAVDRASELPENVEAMPISVEYEYGPNSEVASENPKQEASTPSINPPIENEEMITEAKQNDERETANNESGETSDNGVQSGTSTAAGTGLIEGDEEINSLQKNEGRDEVLPQSDDAEWQVGRREEQNRNRELLERMMQDNERMMGLMAELFERNEMQTRLLGSLSQRVEQLEKAFACEKLRRKKKRNAATAADGHDKLPDTHKYDKKTLNQ